MKRRRFLRHIGGALAAPFVWGSARAEAVTTLRLHHFLPLLSNSHAKLLAPWAKKVETASEGRLKIQIFPSMQLGGTPSQLYDQARDGVVDIAWTLPGYMPGRFPSTEVLELPFIAAKSSVVNAKAAQGIASAFVQQETQDVHLICYWTHDGGHIHAHKPVKTLDDLKGLRLRNPTRLAGQALHALGATPVGMPVPQVPESLAQKVIDGAVLPWEVVPAVKAQELVKYHTEIVGFPTFYVASFLLIMNKARYASLPPDLQAVMDAHSGMAFAEFAGAMWDQQAIEVRAMVEKRGNSIHSLSEEEQQNWIHKTALVHNHWVEEMHQKGLDGGKMIAMARGLIEKYRA